MKAGNSEKSSYRYAILFFSLKLLLLPRTRLESSSYQKKERPKQRCAERFGKIGEFQVTFFLIYLIKRLEKQVMRNAIDRRELSSLQIPLSSAATVHFN